jgi:hypothetical protein
MRSTKVVLSLVFFLGYLLSGGAMAQDKSCVPGGPGTLWIQYGDNVACDFVTSSEIDTFTFLGNNGDEVTVQVASIGLNQIEYVFLYGPDGELKANAGGVGFPAGDEARVDFILNATGTWTIEVEPVGPQEYTLQLPCRGCDAGLPSGGYTAVNPCRIVDTRYGLGGMMSAGEIRNFRVYGNIRQQNNVTGAAPSDYPASCPFDLAEPSAVHINVTVVPRGPRGQGGFVTVWPWSKTQPNASWMNYVSGVQNIANAGTVAITAAPGAAPDAEPDISVYALRDIHLIIDVLGYYTP